MGLFTAKNDLDTVVFDIDQTGMHKAHLFNYLGIRSINGSEFMAIARGQTRDRGVEVHEEKVTNVETENEGFVVTTDDGEYNAQYVVFATGARDDLAEDIGCEATDEGTIDVGLDMETSVENAYATGALVRPEEWQAIISAGDGGAAALHILSKKSEYFHDFDTPSDVP